VERIDFCFVKYLQQRKQEKEQDPQGVRLQVTVIQAWLYIYSTIFLLPFLLLTSSIVIAVIASYTALDLAGQVTAATEQERKLWLAGGAIAMGTGVWSMHFIAMLAYKLPIPVDYNSSIVFASLALAVIASGLAFLYC